jgi:hypothetical protein
MQRRASDRGNGETSDRNVEHEPILAIQPAHCMSATWLQRPRTLLLRKALSFSGFSFSKFSSATPCSAIRYAAPH